MSRRPPCIRASTHTHLLSHTEILGAKQEHPIFQIKKLRLILPKFPQRRQSQNPTQVRINQVCPPLRSLCRSVLGPPAATSLRGGLPNGPSCAVLRGLKTLFASHRPRLAAWDALGFHKLAQLPAHTVTISGAASNEEECSKLTGLRALGQSITCHSLNPRGS